MISDIVFDLLSRAPRAGSTRILAIDGPSGAGKTTLAAIIANELLRDGLSVVTVHTDDLLDGWDDQFTFWDRLVTGVLLPARVGGIGAYRRYDWESAAFAETVAVPAADVLIVEGVTAARAAMRELADLTVFIRCDEDTAWARLAERDAPALLGPLRLWKERERGFFAADRTEECADLRIDANDPPRINVMTTPTLSVEEIRAAIAREFPGVRADLERLVRIPGIAFDGFDFTPLERSAEAVAELVRGCGLQTQIARIGDGHPAIIGVKPAPPGGKTVLLYAHHDVQPVGDLSLWESDPFEPVERDGRLFGRGAADDKAGVMAHIAALRAFGCGTDDDRLPVGVVVFIEGEEEFGSASLPALLEAHMETLRSDVIVIADSGNFDIGIPTLTTSLRGIVNLFVEVRTLKQAVHSGMAGGATPDALMTLSRLLTTLHTDEGDVAIEGLVSGTAAPLDYPEERFRAENAILDGTQLIGTGRIVERIWTKPAISVLAIDAPPTHGAPNAIVPSAKAKLSVRLAPGEDRKRAYETVKAHLEKHVPWGAEVLVTFEHDGDPIVIDSSGPAYDAARGAFRDAFNGADTVEVGVGGSIPFIATFKEAFPQAEVLVTGVEDPHSKAHGPNESLHLEEFHRVCLAEALLLRNVAAM
jgi:acetylornithine deacetylase/succinyl-diaminopimelate desuccinylase-like protein/cytidylate kinase